MEHSFLEKELIELKKMVAWTESKNPKISSANVGWHIAHSLKVILLITLSLKKSKPKDYRKNFNFIRIFAFWFSYIPRGKAQTSLKVIPQEKLTPKILLAQFEQVRKALITLSSLHPHQHFRHFIFGQINLQQTKTFMKIHILHHLKIIRDILNKK